MIQWILIALSVQVGLATQSVTRWMAILSSQVNLASANQKEIQDVSQMTCSILTTR